MELKAYPDEELPLGYVEDRNRGKRIVIVIDDYFNLPNWHELEIPPPTASGLKRLYDIVRGWPLTRAIGFFNLPNPNQIQEDSYTIINCINEWIDAICCEDILGDDTCIKAREEFDYYVLVDIFFGSNFLVGDKFIDHWKEKNIFSSKEKLAYLSSARPPTSNAYNLSFFQKSKIDESGERYLDLIGWLGFRPVPLEITWAKSIGWFDDAQADLVKHDFSQVKEYFISGSPKADQYRKAVEDALDVKFPDAWWQDTASIRNIHESLKHLCGEVFCGSTNKKGRRNISVGAAYLIALMAHQRIYGNIDTLAKDPSLWQEVPRVTGAVFPLQDKPEAKLSAISLYEFFYHIFKPREDPSNISQVKTAYFEQDGVALKIQLKWKATEKALNRPQNLVQQLAERFDSEQIDVPDPDSYNGLPRNTKDAISRLWRNMMFNDDGFMSPGVIYMHKDEVIIASTEYLVSGGSDEA
ncbi:hypothetical protein ACQ4N7_26350 [Nodosilinea sp. AN01ver1]|uniref:hypothetical protein n=1 Tax=Nodosilinea sp. AN01ver1 TaxID=3423362 RepID=UPI003D311B2A